MAQIKVRDIDDWIVNILKDNATGVGQSLEEHLRHVLKDAALANQHRFAKEQAVFLGTMAEKYGTLPDSTEGIREDRAQHG